MRFFIDNNLSEKLAQGMKGFGEDVVHLKEIFPQDAQDTDWLRHIGQKGFILVTRDERIRWRPAERQALRENGVGTFFLAGKGLTGCQLIQQLVRNWPKMKELANKKKRPFMYRLPPKGSEITEIPLS